MEEEIKIKLENITGFNEDEIVAAEHPVYIYLLIVIISLCTIVSFIADLLLAYIVFKNKRMRTKTYIVLLNWAICDAIFLLATHLFSYLPTHDSEIFPRYKFKFCLLADLDISVQFISFLLVLMLVSNTVMRSERITNLAIVLTVYILFALTIIATIFTCVYAEIMYLAAYVNFIMFLFLFTIVVTKDASRCCKKSPISADSRLRLNIGRIYVYNLFVSWTALTVSELVHNSEFFTLAQILHSVGYLNGIFILLYLFYTDRYMKMSVINLFRAEQDRYNIDATVSFADCSDTSDGGMVDIHLPPPTNV